MAKERKFDVDYKKGDLFSDSSVHLHENTGNDLHLSGKGADHFAKHSDRMEIVDEGEYGATFRDTLTGAEFYATRPDQGVGFWLIVGILCALVVPESLPTLATAPAVVISMVHTLPWGPVLLAAMLGISWLVATWVDDWLPYKFAWIGMSVLMAVISLLIMRFGIRDSVMIPTGFGDFLDILGGIFCVILICSGLCNIFLLIGGILARSWDVILPAIYFALLLPALVMVIGGVAYALANYSLALSDPPLSDVVQNFLARFPCTQWPWLLKLLDDLIFTRNPWIVALIGLISYGVIWLLNCFFHFYEEI